MEEELVPVFDENYKLVEYVEANRNLDEGTDAGWPGLHHGLSRLSDGRYVLICETDWCCDRNVAYTITPSEALTLVLESNHEELLMTEFTDLEDQVSNTWL